MIRGAWHSILRLVVMPLGGLAVMLAGCGPSAEIRLTQPELPGRQRELHLMSEQVCWGAGEGVERVLAEFPLPGAATGAPMYLLYLRLPARGGEAARADDEPVAIRGFLIQTRGQYAGKALIVGGRVVISGTSQAGRASRRLEVELTCEDGTRVVGELRARRDDYRLKRFETDRRPADVEALRHPPGDADAGG